MSYHLFIQDLNLNIKGDVLSDEASLGLYSTDASAYQIKPVVVICPKDEVDVFTAVKIAGDYQVSILPRGGGTSLAGQTVGHSMILDFSKYMNQLLEVNVKEKWARVQPGLVRDDFNALVAKDKLHFAPDPATSSRANFGGMIGNNSSGTKSILYGKTVDHVLELKVLLADGTILHLKPETPESYAEKAKTKNREGVIFRKFKEIIDNNRDEIAEKFPKVMRRVQGYNLDEFIYTDHWNLCKIICGSEGTLGIILEAKVNLEPLPSYAAVSVGHYSTVDEAVRAVNEILPFHPSAVEILDKTVVDLCKQNLTTKHHAHFIEGDPAAILVIEFYSEDPQELMDRASLMIKTLQEKGLGYAYPLFQQGRDYDDVWLVRKKGFGLMLGLKGEKKILSFIEDASVPTEVLPEYIEKVLEICRQNQTEVAMYAHASVGLIHVQPILDLRLQEDIDRFKNIADATFELVMSYGGSWSGEHGDGLVRSYYLERFFGKKVYHALKLVKKLFDPQNLMNPGKIIDAQPIDQNLRYGTAYRDEPVSSYFQFREDGNFGNAVHMCTGVGECRKLLGGTMCPSYKATLEEEHSTRGRANLLRLAMSGQLGQDGLLDERLHDALDLCLSCKACKSECPSNVDLAKLKSEVWQKRYDKFGIPLRDRMVRDSAQMSAKISGNLAWFVNKIQQMPVFRSLLENRLQIDKRRVLPTYAVEPFYKWFQKRNANPVTNIEKKVVLFADTYLNFHEPNIGIAATKLLESLGYEVILANVGCCQRPKISHGFLADAKKDGYVTAQKLDQYIQQGLKVVVCEPSCASALNDDLPDLFEDKALGERMKSNIMMIDVFLAHGLEAGRLDGYELKAFPSLQIHGHCHQKALYGTASMKTILNKLTNATVQEIPSGCCGMAGSFGYEKEHYELSEKIGESILFPAIRKMDAATEVVACGVSCRHQIQHFTGKKPKHWTEVFIW